MSPYLYKTKICAIVVNLCPNLVVMATPFALLKVRIA